MLNAFTATCREVQQSNGTPWFGSLPYCENVVRHFWLCHSAACMAVSSLQWMCLLCSENRPGQLLAWSRSESLEHVQDIGSTMIAV